MNIRTSTAEDEKAVKALWAYCFEKESDPWFRWYFEREYRKEEVLVGEEKGKMACNLHRRPYTLSVRGKKSEDRLYCRSGDPSGGKRQRICKRTFAAVLP